MLRLFAIIVAAMVSFSMHSFAKDAQFCDEQIEQFTQQFEETKKRLNLTKEQEEALKPILKENSEKRREIFKSYGFEKGKNKPELSFSKKRSLVKEMRALKEETNGKVSKILSVEQMKEYEKVQDETRKRLKEKMKNK